MVGRNKLRAVAAPASGNGDAVAVNRTARYGLRVLFAGGWGYV